MLNTLLAFLAAKGDALALGVLLGAAITILWLFPPSRLEKPSRTAPTTSSRKSGRTRVTGGAR